jgi:L-ribulose-5-phosphate 3-epimerase
MKAFFEEPRMAKSAKLRIGVLVGLNDQIEHELQKVVSLGLASCQVCSWDPAAWTDDLGRRTVDAAGRLGVTISTFWSGYPGPATWNFPDGPRTIGLVPPKYRAMRVKVLQKAADFAARWKLPSITTHVGFLPSDPRDRLYIGTVEALKRVAGHCANRGIGFNFETGQETPVTLLRTIELVNTGNLGINLDPANLILYGNGNPVDALDVFGKYVVDTHCKDGLYPTNGSELGKETPLGKGKVDFAALVGGLKKLGYRGPLTIEREIGGPQQVKDIRKAIALLRPLC